MIKKLFRENEAFFHLLCQSQLDPACLIKSSLHGIFQHVRDEQAYTIVVCCVRRGFLAYLTSWATHGDV